MTDQQNDTPIPEENGDEGESENRLDRLMGAKDEADRQAEEWRRIEDLGLPVSSSDKITEPPFQEGDTPPGQHTPGEGVPKIDPSQIPRFSDIQAEIEEEDEDEATDPLDLKPVQPAEPRPFLHPTDPIPDPSASAGLHPTDTPPVPEAPVPSTPADDVPFQVTPSSAHTPVDSGESVPGVRVDESGMPLPRQVPHVDPDATIPGESAFKDELEEPPLPPDATIPHGYDRPEFEILPSDAPIGGRAAQLPPTPPAHEPIQPHPVQPAAEIVGTPQPRPSQVKAQQQPVETKPRKKRRRRPRLTLGCMMRTALLGLVGGLVALLIGGGGAAIYYSQVTAPSFQGITEITDLQERALQFETTRIYDSQGNLLYQINDPQGGLRDYVTIDEISPYLIHATVSTEERDFFTNPGFSIPAIIRAVIQNFREGRSVSGASTITQQLTRALLLPEEERYEHSYQRKIKEIFLAAELGRRFSKEEILELYLNQIYYGNLAYGIEAASQTYFNKSASELTLAEAAFLAGIPQAPAVWDPVSIDPDTGQSVVVLRQSQVLGLMIEANCIDTGKTGLQLPCVTGADLAASEEELGIIATTTFYRPELQAKYPHWVVYIQQILEADEAIGPAIYTSGFDVYTTLDPRIQDAAQAQVDLTLSGLTDRNVTNASVVVIDVDTGAILAMIGSHDFDNPDIDGQVNIALTYQQPGSSIKPFTYLATFRKGWNPATIIWDVPIEYEIPGFGVYEPVNYDGKFRGPVTVRTAIANSLNIPAILAVDYAGIDGLLEVLNDVGIDDLGDPSNPYNYGLSLTLGAGEVRLLDWTNAYATLANGGTYRPTFAIERIEVNGEPIEGYPYEVPDGDQNLDPARVYMLQTILTDYEARVPSFGVNSPLSPPGYIAGAKTGTTNDFRDNWTMGFTTEIAVGVWVGNTDNSPMLNVTGVTGAGPIWRAVMDASQNWYPSGGFVPPPGMNEQTVCRDDGAIPSDYCLENSSVFTDIFGPENPPPEADEGLYQTLTVDTFSGLIANDFCKDFTETREFYVFPNPSQLIDIRPFIQEWITQTETGQAWAIERGIAPEAGQLVVPPTEECDQNTPRPVIEITNPQPGETYEGELLIRGTAMVPSDFSHYRVEFGLGPNPGGWGEVQGNTPQQVEDNNLALVNLDPFAGGEITIRLIVFDNAGHSAETRVTFRVADPTPTPTPTTTPTPENTPTNPTATLDLPTLTPAPTEEQPTVAPTADGG